MLTWFCADLDVGVRNIVVLSDLAFVGMLCGCNLDAFAAGHSFGYVLPDLRGCCCSFLDHTGVNDISDSVVYEVCTGFEASGRSQRSMLCAGWHRVIARRPW